MKSRSFWLIGIIVTLASCTPGMNMYQTPAVYFTGYQRVPVTDSGNNQMVAGTLQYPWNMDLYYEHRIKDNWILQAGYKGNLGINIQKYANLFRYNYTFHFLDGGGGYEFKINQGNRFAMLAGLGVGFAKSAVYEDGSEQYEYEGNFTRFHFTPVYSHRGEQISIFLSWEQSIINFRSYKLPDQSYENKRQTLSTPQILVTTELNNDFKLGVYLAATLNATKPGDRSIDKKFDVWRTEPLAFGFGFFKTFGK